MAVHPSYCCRCQIPKSVVYLGEDTGLCFYCRGIYDQQLYERRLRQHVKGFTYDTLHDFLTDVDPNYRRLAQ